MGNTTIIELNHDKYSEIEEHPELFIEQILEQLRTMNNDGDSIQGGSIVCSFNRNGGTLDCEWQKFLLKVGKYINDSEVNTIEGFDGYYQRIMK